LAGSKTLNKANMKKSMVLLSTVIGALSLTAFVFINHSYDQGMVITATAHNEKDSVRIKTELSCCDNILPPSRAEIREPFVYEIGSRFIATVTKKQIEKATNVHDLLPTNADWSTFPVERLNVTLERDTKQTEIGPDMTLTDAQLALLMSASYSDNFSLVANGKQVRHDRRLHDLVYYISVVPEKEAAYAHGKDNLMAYLKEKSKEVIANVDGEKLQPGQISFTVSTQGTITDVALVQTSGYIGIDIIMIELLNNAPGSWEPAENGKGEKIEQTFTFFYGRIGC
jgi:hypothetical protein